MTKKNYLLRLSLGLKEEYFIVDVLWVSLISLLGERNFFSVDSKYFGIKEPHGGDHGLLAKIHLVHKSWLVGKADMEVQELWTIEILEPSKIDTVKKRKLFFRKRALFLKYCFRLLVNATVTKPYYTVLLKTLLG